jgi:hypothetical protein
MEHILISSDRKKTYAMSNGRVEILGAGLKHDGFSVDANRF